MKKSIEEMREELIRLAYESRTKEKDFEMTDEEKKRRIAEIAADREKAYKILYSFAEGIDKARGQNCAKEKVKKTEAIRKYEEKIVEIQYGTYDSKCISKISELKQLDGDEVIIEYVNAMFSRKIEYDEELARQIVEYLVDEYSSELSMCIDDVDLAIELNRKTGHTAQIWSMLSKKALVELLQDSNRLSLIVNKEGKSNNSLYGYEEFDLLINQISQYDDLYKSKEFMMKLIDTIILIEADDGDLPRLTDGVFRLVFNKGGELLQDREFENRLLDLLVHNHYDCRNFYEDCRDRLLATPELSEDRELALKYCKSIGTKNVSPKLLEDREFFKEMLENCELVDLQLPAKYRKDLEILRLYFRKVQEPSLDGISITLLNDPEISRKIEETYGLAPNRILLKKISDLIETTGTVATHYGDDLDNKAAIEAIQRWAEGNDLIKIGHPLTVLRVPAGETHSSTVNVDTGGHSGSRMCMETDGDNEKVNNIVIDGDAENAIKSACEALSTLRNICTKANCRVSR